MEPGYTFQAQVFKAFCDENRLRIVELLQVEDLCACVLMQKLGMKQSALSYHMKVLVESGVVRGTPVGKWTHYHLSEAGCQTARALLEALTTRRTLDTETCTCCEP